MLDNHICLVLGSDVYCDTQFEGEICPGCGAPASLIREEIREEEMRKALKMQRQMGKKDVDGYILPKDVPSYENNEDYSSVNIEKKPAWYTKNWAIGICWLFCFPIAPILLLVYKKSWKDWLKSFGLSIVYFFVLGMLLASTSETPEESIETTAIVVYESELTNAYETFKIAKNATTLIESY